MFNLESNHIKMSAKKCDLRNDFCFVCGLRIFYTGQDKRLSEIKRSVNTQKFIKGYKKEFGYEPKSSDWSPDVSCEKCYTKLASQKKLRLSSPMEWNEPQKHPEECYFCQTEVKRGTNKLKRDSIKYADVPSVKKAR